MGSTREREAGALTFERVALLDNGLRVGFSEETVSTGKVPNVHGIAIAEGIWLRTPSRACWTPTPDWVAAVRDPGFGQPILRTGRKTGAAPYDHGWVIDPGT